MHFALTAHAGFHNRGCEAIVRSSVSLLREIWEDPQVELYSSNPNDILENRDGSLKIHFSGTPRYSTQWLIRGTLRRYPQLTRTYGRTLGRVLHSADASLSVGGDNYTLDYGYPGECLETDRLFLSSGTPVVIWGASIGPFEKDPGCREAMKEHLSSVQLITARESTTVEYLKSLGVTRNVVQVFDPAFLLEPEPYEGPEGNFVESRNVLGLNVSALAARWHTQGDLDRFLGEAAAFAEEASARGLGVLLIPHVSLKGGPLELDDEETLRLLLEKTGNSDEQIRLLPGNIPAGRIKWIISKCRFFIGARTHSTIAALSTGVPTISIAYSPKALGMNRDIFGHDDYVLNAREISRHTLNAKLDLLQKRESDIRRFLSDARPGMMKAARRNGEALADFLAGRKRGKG